MLKKLRIVLAAIVCLCIVAVVSCSKDENVENANITDADLAINAQHHSKCDSTKCICDSTKCGKNHGKYICDSTKCGKNHGKYICDSTKCGKNHGKYACDSAQCGKKHGNTYDSTKCEKKQGQTNGCGNKKQGKC